MSCSWISARVASSADTGSGLAGTPLYLAPEVFGGMAATARSDIYSVGVLLYHLLTRSYRCGGATFAPCVSPTNAESGPTCEPHGLIFRPN